MWLFTKAGFFSVVQSSESEDESVLSVRARIGGDLDRLREMYMPKLGPTVQLPGRDYPYRAYIQKEALAEGMVRLALDIDYGNFKSMVMTAFGLAREQLYAKVWGVMYDAERKIGKERGPANPRTKTPAQTKRVS